MGLAVEPDGNRRDGAGGATEAAAPEAKRGARCSGGHGVDGGVAVLASVAADTPGEKEFLALLWLVDVGYLVFLAVRGLMRRSRKGASATKSAELPKPVENTAVAGMVETPADSPSRADAERELPEYASGVLSAHEQAEKRP